MSFWVDCGLSMSTRNWSIY